MRINLKIVNDTDWSTSDIRRIILATLKHEGMEEGQWRFRVQYGRQQVSIDGDGREWAARGDGLMGYAYYNSTRCILGFPNTAEVDLGPARRRVDRPRSAQRLAQLIVHELCHCRGLKHGEMQCWTTEEWAADLPPVRRAAVKVKATATKEGREAKARADVVRIEAKLAALDVEHERAVARWTKKLRKARSSVRRYDRIAAEPKPKT